MNTQIILKPKLRKKSINLNKVKTDKTENQKLLLQLKIMLHKHLLIKFLIKKKYKLLVQNKVIKYIFFKNLILITFGWYIIKVYINYILSLIST